METTGVCAPTNISWLGFGRGCSSSAVFPLPLLSIYTAGLISDTCTMAFRLQTQQELLKNHVIILPPFSLQLWFLTP